MLTYMYGKPQGTINIGDLSMIFTKARKYKGFIKIQIIFLDRPRELKKKKKHLGSNSQINSEFSVTNLQLHNVNTFTY